MNTSFYRYLFIITFFTFAITVATAQSRKKQKDIDKVIGYAKNYIGTPYNYGGSSKNGIDCSGLIYNCYTAIGVSLPRTAKDQSKIGNSKNWDSIRPGDIVYFKFKQKGEKWYH
ncbi:MAG: putative lipoprotein NlpC, partial [Marinoscillum sp.]